MEPRLQCLEDLRIWRLEREPRDREIVQIRKRNLEHRIPQYFEVLDFREGYEEIKIQVPGSFQVPRDLEVLESTELNPGFQVTEIWVALKTKEILGGGSFDS